MSLGRQRHNTRVNSRANTLPSLSNTTVDTDTSVTTIDTSNTFLPSIEESLQDWISRSIPDTPSSSISYMLESCRCCNESDCENFETLASTIRKLDSDARLAAVIGQSLLQKHEQYVNETNEVKQSYQQEVELLNQKVQELEQSLLESDTSNKEYLEEKNRAFWEWQKTQKTLDETTSDLEICNNRCLHLGTELKAKNNEIEKLRVFKFMARQADVREETLRAKLEDVKQELAVSRKAELTLESKHKKLKSKYESICMTLEKLKMDQQELGITKDFQIDLVWLRESNEKLRKDVLKLTSALLSPNTAADLQMTNSHLIELIKELASANNKLKSDLLDCTDLLMECRSDLYTKINQQQDDGTDNHLTVPTNNQLEQKRPVLKRTASKRAIHQAEESDARSIIPAPQTSTSTPTSSSPTVVHHHYHYYMRNKEKGKTNAKRLSLNKLANNEKINTDSSISISSQASKIDSSSPFHQLYTQVDSLIQRLQQTDIRALNRRLKRAFDIFELSGMSNSIIENIVSDVESLQSRFSWVEDQTVVKHEIWVHDISMLEFFPIMKLLQEMLKEISQLRTTMNDLQVEYVKKVEESDIKLEAELLLKQQQQQRTTKKKEPSALSWFTNMFQRPKEQPLPPSPTTLQHTRFLNSSETSIHSTIHPLSSKPKMIPSDNSMKAVRRQKSDIDRYGPPSSFPSRSYHYNNSVHSEKANKRRSTIPNFSISSSPSNQDNDANIHIYSSASTNTSSITMSSTIKPFPLPLRASQSAGTVRKSNQPAIEYVVRRKRSTLGFSSSSSNDFDFQPTTAEMAGTFTTSWLGNK